MEQIKRKIDSILADVSAKIANRDYDGLENLLSSREQLIAELVTSYVHDDTLKLYLNAIRTHDRNMMQVLRDNREEVGQTLKKVDKVKGYLR